MKIRTILFIIIFYAIGIVDAQSPIISPNQNLNTCDKKYILEMQKILDLFKNNTNSINLELIKQYMLMVKQSTDLRIKIKEFEDNFLDVKTKDRLRQPILLYDRCKNLVRGRIR